jgi:hypothetical protein
MLVFNGLCAFTQFDTNQCKILRVDTPQSWFHQAILKPNYIVTIKKRTHNKFMCQNAILSMFISFYITSNVPNFSNN